MKKLRQIMIGIASSVIIFGCTSTPESDLTGIISALERQINATLTAKADAGKFYSKYLVPNDDEIKKVAKRTLLPDELTELRQNAESLTRRAERTIVWPKWISAVWAKTQARSEQLLKASKFGEAREVIWNASTTGVADVDAGIRKLGYEFMNTRINPVEWKIIERQMRDKALDCAKHAAYDEGIEWMKKVPHVREYSSVLDGRLTNVKAEIVKLSIPEGSVTPIMVAAQDMMKKAEQIYDYRDTTTNAVTGVTGDADLKQYEEKLKQYREALLLYNCTEANADKIINALKKDVAPLLDPLYSNETTSRSFLYLGTGAINKRIDAYAARLAKWLETKRAFRETLKGLLAANKTAEARKLVQEDVEAVTIAPEKTTVKTTKADKVAAKVPSAVDLAFEGERLRFKVNALVAQSKWVEARELIWASCYPEKQTVLSLYLQPIGKELMLAVINPANWAAIENTITNDVAKAIARGTFTNAIAVLESYPRIKTYAGVIDAKLQSAADEARALGVADATVKETVKVTAASASEMANLADHTDKVGVVKLAGRHLNFDRFNALVEEYRKTLVRNDCTKENAERLAAEFKAALEPKFKELAADRNVDTLMLGCNALNDRIGKLADAKIAELKAAHQEMVAKEEAERNFIDDLVKRVVELAKEGKYGEAREAIRDAEPAEDAVLNARRYAVRIGLLNKVVNPRQCRALKAEIAGKVKDFKAAKDYAGLREYVKGYPYVHDTYQQLVDALGQIKEAMLGLDISEESAECYVNKESPCQFQKPLQKRIQEFLEKRDGGITFTNDLTALEKALADLQVGFMRHYDSSNAVANLCRKFEKEILELQAKELPPMTTYEMNGKLRTCLMASLWGIDRLEYAKLLEEIGAEVSFDAQIAMAESAISRQVGVVCPCAAFEMNAVMGDYARIVRGLKCGGKVSENDATTLLVGAVYLNQPAMFKRALELGAKIDSPAARDPRKRPAVLVAIQMGHTSFLASVNEAKGRQDVVDAKGNTALHYAMCSGNLTVAKAIFATIDPKAVNEKGETALFSAVRRNQAGAAKFLIGLFKGDDDERTGAIRKEFVGIKNSVGKNAFDVACESNARDVLDVLASAGAEYGTANLVEAAKANRIAIAQWLVEHGADVNAEGVMAAAFGKPDDDDTATYRYLVKEGGIALKRTPKCCKDARAKLAEAEKKLAEKTAEKAKVSGSVTFEAIESK